MESTVCAGPASDASTCPLELLEREITELAAHVHAGMCRWLELVGEFDRREGWADWGCKSCAQWLSHTCALGSLTAREHVRVARRLGELPAIRAAFERGELSYSQVRALTRVATAELEAELLELARHATAAQLERTLRAYRGVLRRELTADDAAHGDRYVVCEYDDDGSLLIRGRLPAEEGALVMNALEAGRDALREAAHAQRDAAQADAPVLDQPSSEDRGVSAETESRVDASNAAALVLMAETLLESGPAERSAADSYQVVVHVDSGSLAANEPDAGACQIDDGPFLHPETARRLACDASLVRILERDGRPLSVGRRTRTIPPALRRALQSRDGCCQFPGCTQRRHLHAHHIDHWAHGGRTDLSNLVHLCRFHHRLLHEGGYTLERAGRQGELRFRRPDGRAVPDALSPGGGRVDGLKSGNAAREVDVSPDTCASKWLGDRLDVGMTIDCLVAKDPRLLE